MKAIYDKNVALVGWLQEGQENVFDTEMNWEGFVRKGNYFSRKADWLGGYFQGTFVDKYGHPVAWINGTTPASTSVLPTPVKPPIPGRPLRPVRPLRPIRPMRPLTPIGGWSGLSWAKYNCVTDDW